MKSQRTRSLVFAAAMLLGGATILSAAAPAQEDAELSARLITAIANSDYEAFSAEWGAPFQAKLKKEPFSATSARFAARLQAGYEVSYLGDLRQDGHHVTLWKVSFKDQSDDALVTLVTIGEKAAGFWIK